MEQVTMQNTAEAIQKYATENNFDLTEILYEKNDTVIVAFGHKNSKYNELQYYNKKAKTLKTLFIDGTHSFYEFVQKTKAKYQQS